MKLCEIISHLTAQETEVNIVTESEDIRAFSTHNLHMKVESDYLTHAPKEN
jgi:hypothetical protein